MYSQIVLVIAAALASFGCAHWVRSNALRLGLVQAPNDRSSHVSPTPQGGGLGIVVAGTACICILGPFVTHGWWAVLAATLLIAAVGFWDDIAPVSASLRLVVQGIAVITCVIVALSFPFSVSLTTASWHDAGYLLVLCLAGVWWMNLFNFMDGIDGLAGAQGVFMLLGAGGLIALGQGHVPDSPLWWLLVSLAAATTGFLLVNWPPARIFMGDVGSTYLACATFVLALFTVVDGWMSLAAWLILGTLFVSDATVTLIRRVLRRERVTQAHRSHAYQRLARRVGGHRPVTLGWSIINLVVCLPLAWGSLRCPEWALAWVVASYLPVLAVTLWLGAGKHDHE